MPTNWYIDTKKKDNYTMRARCAIKPGDEIIHEPPLIKLKMCLTELYNPHTFFEEGAHSGFPALHKEIEALNKTNREAFHRLRNAHPNADPKKNSIGIIETNVFNEEEHSSKPSQQVYQNLILYNIISRVNHSCKPNAELHWNTATQEGSLRALNHMAANDEITINYLGSRDSLNLSKERKKDLDLQYDFTCECAVCHLARTLLSANDRLRMEARQRHDTLFISELGTVRIAEEYIERLGALDINDGRLATGYSKLSYLEEAEAEAAARTVRANGHHCNRCQAYGNAAALWHFDKARKAYTEALQIDIMTHGPDHPTVTEDRNAFDRITIRMIKHGP